MPEIGTQIHVGEGRVRVTSGGISFGGRNAVPGTANEPAKVRIAAWDGKTEEFSVYLHEGETLKIAGQTWRLDKIHTEGVQHWSADLTRIA